VARMASIWLKYGLNAHLCPRLLLEKQTLPRVKEPIGAQRIADPISDGIQAFQIAHSAVTWRDARHEVS